MNLGAVAEEEEQLTPIAEFEGYAECPMFSEEVKITLTMDKLMVTALFDQFVLPHSEITSFAFENYRVVVNTRDSFVTFSRMGDRAEWLYDKLYGAYNEAVLAALNVQGKHIFEARGEFSAEESGSVIKEQGMVRLYENCLCLLPPNENARRIPLCFMTGMEKSDYSRTFVLSTGERYMVTKLGRDLDNLDCLLTAKLHALREQTLSWHNELAPEMPSAQATFGAKLMPFGAAADARELAASVPALLAGIETKVRDTRIAETYPWLKKLCGGYGFFIGAMPAPPKEEGEDIPELSDAEDEDAEKESPPIIWAIAPNKSGRIAAVELALDDNQAAATYLYRVKGDTSAFLRQTDRALHAAGFKRELITLPEEKLRLPEHAAAAMLIARTPSLKLMRVCFEGKVIHSSFERWQRDIEKCSALPSLEEGATSTNSARRFCGNCGAKLSENMNFCGQCGSKI